MGSCWIKKWRKSKGLIVFVVAFALFIDALIMTVVGKFKALRTIFLKKSGKITFQKIYIKTNLSGYACPHNKNEFLRAGTSKHVFYADAAK